MKKYIVLLTSLLLIACGSSLPDAKAAYGPFYTVASNSTGITASTSCSQTSGTAPFAVLFSAVGTVSTHTSVASDVGAGFREIYYSWNFGDSGAGNWTTGAPTSAGGTGNSKNTAFDPVVAHVFATAGTYTVKVSMTASDGTATGSETLSNVTACVVTVSDPNTVYATTSTICVSGTGTFTNCPTGATQVTSSSATTGCSDLASGKRVLFHSGETFTGNCSISSVSGAYLGAYDTGAKPILQPSSGGVFSISSSSNVTVEGLDFNQNGVAAAIGFTLSSSSGETNHDILILGNAIHGGATSANSGHLIGDDGAANSSKKDLFLVGNDIHDNGVSAEAVYMTTYDFAIMGNNFHTMTSNGYHEIRVGFCNTCTINNNSFADPQTASTYEMVTMRTCVDPTDTACNTLGGTNNDTKYWVISDNYFKDNQGSGPYILTVRPVLSSQTGYVQYGVIARNYMVMNGTAAGQDCIVVNGQHLTIQDNICDGTATAGVWSEGILVGLSGFTVTPDDVNAYNNSIRALVTDASFPNYAVTSQNSSTNVRLVNNLAYLHNAGAGGAQFLRTGASGVITNTNNSSDVQVQSTDPLWTNGSGLFNAPSDYKPGATSYAISGGTGVPVWADDVGTAWSPAWDQGAVHH